MGENPNQTLVIFDIDIEVLEWYKSQQIDYQSRINAVLRAYYDAHHHDHRK